MHKYEEKVISVYTEWLNKHHEANEEDDRVTREMYDEWDGPPRTLLDKDFMVGTIYQDRIIRLEVNPYHDEGGPAFLTAWFSYNPDAEKFGNDAWELQHVVQEFDTFRQIIWAQGKFEGIE